MAFAAGQRVRAADLNRVGNIAGRNTRTLDLVSTSGGTAVPVLSVRAPVVTGRSYSVRCFFGAYAVTAGAGIQVHFRYRTNDTEPTVADTTYAAPRCDIVGAVASQIYDGYSEGIFDATYTGYLRVLCTLVRSSGAGNVALASGTVNPMTLLIMDVGDTIASSGTVY